VPYGPRCRRSQSAVSPSVTRLEQKTASWAALPARITVSKNVKCVLTTAQISPRFNICGRGRPPHRSDYVGRYVFIASLPLLLPAVPLVAAGVAMFLITGSRVAAAIVLPGPV
jgi:hypothetical protein